MLLILKEAYFLARPMAFAIFRVKKIKKKKRSKWVVDNYGGVT